MPRAMISRYHGNNAQPQLSHTHISSSSTSSSSDVNKATGSEFEDKKWRPKKPTALDGIGITEVGQIEMGQSEPIWIDQTEISNRIFGISPH